MKSEFIKLIRDIFSPEKRLWRFFAVFFVIALLSFNWNKLYWIFDQKAVSGIIESQLAKGAIEKEIDDNPQSASSEDNANPVAAPALNPLPEKKPAVVQNPGKKVTVGNTIYIPAINSWAPILESGTNTNTAYLAILKKGVLHYSDSVNPGELGAVIILGHSAPLNWPDINYDNVFSAISKLKSGDEIRIVYGGKTYVYQTIEGQVIDKGGEIPEGWLENDTQKIILLSCWPPGKDYKRYGVVAELLTY